MFGNLTTKDVTALNDSIQRLCRNPSDYGELAQLRWLFRRGFRRQLQKLLNDSLASSPVPSAYDVGIGWIDKIPLAKSSKLSRKTELGDAILYYFDDLRDPSSGKLLNRRSRAALLQAKIADSAAQMASPIVPISKSRSTPRELRLLSEWPPFDLFQTSGHDEPCLTNVRVTTPSMPPPPHGWFVVAPSREPWIAERGSWPCWWMAGPATDKCPCSTTLGEVIVGFLQPGSTTASVGADFLRDNSPRPTKSGGTATWDDLCNEVLRILDSYRAPKKTFGGDHPRSVSIRTASSHSIAASAASRNVVSLSEFLDDRDLVSHYYNQPVWPTFNSNYPPPRHISSDLGEGEKRGLLVLSVTLTRFEGG